MGGDNSLANKCMDLCQALQSQGRSFSFTLTIASSFTFSLDSKVEVTTAPNRAVKKVSPSTQRRNIRRKEQFLKKKPPPSMVPEETISAKENKDKSNPVIDNSKPVKQDEPPLDLSRKRNDTEDRNIELESLKKQISIKNNEVDQIKAVNRSNVDKMKKIIIDVLPFLPPKKKTASWLGVVEWART